MKPRSRSVPVPGKPDCPCGYIAGEHAGDPLGEHFEWCDGKPKPKGPVKLRSKGRKPTRCLRCRGEFVIPPKRPSTCTDCLDKIAARRKLDTLRREGEVKGLLRARRIWKRMVSKERVLYGPWPKLGLLDDALSAEVSRLRKVGR